MVGVAGPVGIAGAGVRVGKVEALGALGDRGRGDAAAAGGEDEVQGQRRPVVPSATAPRFTPWG